jgi:hypothetical protein
MSLIDQYTTSQDTTFRQKVQMAMVKTAVDVQGESTGTANHTNRSTYAAQVLNSPEAYIGRFALAAAEGGAVTTTSSDSNIINQVSAIWDAMAGVL